MKILKYAEKNAFPNYSMETKQNYFINFLNDNLFNIDAKWYVKGCLSSVTSPARSFKGIFGLGFAWF